MSNIKVTRCICIYKVFIVIHSLLISNLKMLKDDKQMKTHDQKYEWLFRNKKILKSSVSNKIKNDFVLLTSDCYQLSKISQRNSN